MAKSTNHTAHNQSYKNHRNGIKKPQKLGKGQRRALRGVRAAPLRSRGARTMGGCGVDWGRGCTSAYPRRNRPAR